MRCGLVSEIGDGKAAWRAAPTVSVTAFTPAPAALRDALHGTMEATPPKTASKNNNARGGRDELARTRRINGRCCTLVLGMSTAVWTALPSV
mmetsp:Transcript_38797/g.107881  ORF Transcript_38797/g.107881 Transcript_38797/m.107881 type:complete len:92 (-) Transcript_38797:58-333(-)